MKASAAANPNLIAPRVARHRDQRRAGRRSAADHAGWMFIVIMAVLLGAAFPSRAASLAMETFGSSSSGWVDRDAAEMSVSYNAGFGNTAGSLHGSFASQGSPSFESDAFRATAASSGGAFSGNFNLTYPTFTSLAFDFLAEDILPSTLIFRIGDGVNTFLYNVNPQLNALATWTTVNVSLAYSAGWIGGSAAQFASVFNNVTFMDVQVGRNGTGAQDFYLDNFTLLDDPQSSGGVVPEPNSIGLLLVGIGAVYHLRRRLPGRRLTIWHEGR